MNHSKYRKKVGIIGAGYQAETQLEAIAAVRQLSSAKVYSRTPERRNTFADRMSERLGIDVLDVFPALGPNALVPRN